MVERTFGTDAREPRGAGYLLIRPRSRWDGFHLRELWAFRDLLRTFVERDLKLRYKQTGLGIAWVVIQPLLAAAIFTFVFGRVAKLPSEGLPYALFAYAGLMGWTLFSQTLSRAATSLVGNAGMVSKVYFPRALLPLSSAGSVLVDFLVAGVMLVVLLVAYSVRPGWAVLLLPLWVAVTLALALGVGLAVAAASVRYRDIQYILPVLVQMLLYATPVAYGLSAVPNSLRGYLALNPLTQLCEAYRWSLIGGPQPSLPSLLWPTAAAAVSLVLGMTIFSAREREFVDVL